MKKQTHGGKRPNAGRPKKPPTVRLSFRVPPDKVQPVKDAVKSALQPR